MRVLVVDDTVSIRERLAAMIADIDGVSSVSQAADGLEGLTSAIVDPPDVLVLDIRMPRMNGFQLLAALDAECAAPPTRVVVSNHAEYVEHALLVGATHFFDKSTEIDGLLDMLSGLAAGVQNEIA